MLFDVLKRVAKDLPGCVLTSVVSYETGLSVARVAPDAQSGEAADAFQTDLQRVVRLLAQRSGGGGKIDEVVLHSQKTTFLAIPLGDTGYFWHVATSIDTTLGFTQALIRKNVGDVTEGLRALTDG